MSREEFFSATGGRVMIDTTGERVRFACGVDYNDQGVDLEPWECQKLGLMLLQSVLTTDEQAILRALVSMAEHRIHDPIIL